MNTAESQANAGPDFSPDLGEERTGLRSYAARAAVIRSSQRALLVGGVSQLLPPFSWALCISAHRELQFASKLSLDPLIQRSRWWRQAMLGAIPAVATFASGGHLGVLALIGVIAFEVLHVFWLYYNCRPGRWNPARSRLYLAMALVCLVRIQVFAWLTLGSLWFARMLYH